MMVSLKSIAKLVCILSMSGCAPYEAPNEDDLEHELLFSAWNIEGRSIHVVESGDRNKQMVLFIHGTPGSWEGYGEYLQMSALSSRAHLVAIDRPGFGKFSEGDWLPPLQEQASILIKLRELNRSALPVIVVGHSLGGTIAYRMAVDFPDEIAGIVVVSAPLDPELSYRRWYNVLASFSLINWALPDALNKANREMNPLQGDLVAMAPRLPEIRTRVTVIQGTEDKLVKFENLDFAERSLQQARFKSIPVAGRGHFILWEQPQLVAAEILAFLNESQ
ncbi:MAG: alpha/beta hydrolase [Pseudomonadales bacterium]|jgi:pimeloyl-ACP methyl ester carboxylesterase